MFKPLVILCGITTSLLFFLQGEPANALPNVMILSLAQVATQTKT